MTCRRIFAHVRRRNSTRPRRTSDGALQIMSPDGMSLSQTAPAKRASLKMFIKRQVRTVHWMSGALCLVGMMLFAAPGITPISTTCTRAEILASPGHCFSTCSPLQLSCSVRLGSGCCRCIPRAAPAHGHLRLRALPCRSCCFLFSHIPDGRHAGICRQRQHCSTDLSATAWPTSS